MSENKKKVFRVLVANFSPSLADLRFVQHVIGEDRELVVLTKKDYDNLEKNPDLILFTGGEDVNPKYYNELVGKYTSINEQRDEMEKDIFHRIFYGVPRLGICRGSQFLTVMSGGKLIQHVEGHGIADTHNITLLNEDPRLNMEIPITSTHHQMLFPFNLPKHKYQLLACSTHFRSSVYLNGNNEQIELPENFLEPEIVYYPDYNSLAIQGHPEYMDPNSKTVQIIKKMIINKLNLFKNEK